MRKTYIVWRYTGTKGIVQAVCSTDKRALEILAELGDYGFSGYCDMALGSTEDGYDVWPMAYRANGRTIQYRMDLIDPRHVDHLDQA